MAGHVDKVVGRDQIRYTISTARKLGMWESAVFEGRAGFISSKNLRYAQLILDDSPSDAHLMHVHVTTMVQVVDPKDWILWRRRQSLWKPGRAARGEAR